MMTPTITNLPPTTASSSGDSGAASEPGDLLSAEFAAMFASLCAQPVNLPTPVEPAQAEVTGPTIELTSDVTLKTETPCVLNEAAPQVDTEAEVIQPTAESDITVEADVQSEPTSSLAYSPNVTTPKGQVVSRRETRLTPTQVTEPTPDIFVETAPESGSSIATTPIELKNVPAQDKTAAEPLVVTSQRTNAAPLPPTFDDPIGPIEPVQSPVPRLEVTAGDEPVEVPQTTTPPVTASTRPDKGLPVPVIKPVESDEKPKSADVEVVTETGKVESTEPLNLKTQTEATRRISNLIATYLIEGARNGSSPSTARFGGLEFELELDSSGRQKRPSGKSDGKSMDFSLRMRPFSDLLADSMPAAKELSPVTQVSQRVVELAKGSTREVESLNFKLNPEELGEVDLQLTRHKDGSISAHLTTERETARLSLTRSVDELRQSLEQAGVHVAKLQVSTGTSSTDNSRRQEREATSHATNFRNGTTANSNEPEASSNTLADNNRLLSLRA